MKEYKVWVEIEEYDTETESGETTGLMDIGCSGTFDTIEEAHAHAKLIHDAGRDGPGWTE
jgi:hypothetical protein